MKTANEKKYPRVDVRKVRGGSRWGLDQMIWRVREILFPGHYGTVVFEARFYPDAEAYVKFMLDPKPPVQQFYMTIE